MQKIWLRAQTLIMIAIMVLLVANTICFGLFVVDGEISSPLKEVR